MKHVRVYANDVDVGTLTTDKYKAICAEAKRDWMLYLAQGLNCGYVAFRMMCNLLRVVPILIFWLLILDALYDPDGFTEIINGLVKEPAVFASDFLRLAIQIAVPMIAIIAISFALFGHAAGRAFGFVDVFDSAINKRIRQTLKLPVNADLKIVEDVEVAMWREI